MKKLLFLSFVLLGFLMTSCGADSETVNKATDELCEVMNNFDETDPSSMLEASTKLTEISENEDYASITEDQMLDAMAEKCPEGKKKLEELIKAGEAAE